MKKKKIPTTNIIKDTHHDSYFNSSQKQLTETEKNIVKNILNRFARTNMKK